MHSYLHPDPFGYEAVLAQDLSVASGGSAELPQGREHTEKHRSKGMSQQPSLQQSMQLGP